MIVKFDFETWSIDVDKLSTINLSAYGTANTIMNFGHFQYVLAIPRNADGSDPVFVSKLTLIIETTPSLKANVGNIAAGLPLMALQYKNIFG